MAPPRPFLQDLCADPSRSTDRILYDQIEKKRNIFSPLYRTLKMASFEADLFIEQERLEQNRIMPQVTLERDLMDLD